MTHSRRSLTILSSPLLDNTMNDQTEGTSAQQRQSFTPAQIMAMISNFSTSYNVVNISLVLPMVKSLYPGTAEDQAACASSLLAGMMIGQVMGGALGDGPLGRLGALRFVMALQIVASLLSAATMESPHFYAQLAGARLLLGIGAGGVYPLAAVLSAEQGAGGVERTTLQQLRRVALTFSMQGVGFLAVPVVALSLLYTTKASQLDLVWRFILGLGSLPGLILIFFQWNFYQRVDMEVLPQSEEVTENVSCDPITKEANLEINFDDEEVNVDEQDCIFHPSNVDLEQSSSTGNFSLWSALKTEPQLCSKLLGTAGTWFLFDVLFYGNTLFQPIVLEAAFGGRIVDDEDELKKTATDSLFLAMIALPGYIVSAFVMGKRLCFVKQTPRYVQLQGFCVMAILYATISAYWGYLKRQPNLLVFIYGMTFFFANYGPNTTTFVFPSLVYSPECRSTLNGISAAAGKAGALLGATLFAPTADALGDSDVMLICACVSVMAFGLTYCFSRKPNTRASSDPLQ